jgi:MFS family permease
VRSKVKGLGSWNGLRRADCPVVGENPTVDGAEARADNRGSVLHNPTVLGISLASLLSDTGHEMATAALPGFLRSIGAPAAALGAIEGIADGAMSAAKVAGGIVADRPGVERKAVASGGYAVVALGHASFALAHAWPVVAVSRAVSWIARGGKNPSRDSLLAGSVERADLGKAIGLERGMDSVGAVIGPLLAAPVLLAVGYRWLFAISLLPGIGAALTVLLLVRETPRIRAARPTLHGSMRTLAATPGPFRRLITGIGLFGLGNFSSTLLILRATILLNRHGRSAAHAAAIAVLLYAGLNAANALAAYPAGAIADRVGRRPVIIAGIVAFGTACSVFAFGSSSIAVLAVLFVIVGASTGMVETAQSAYAAQLVEDHLRGRAFGLLGLVEGIGDLVSSVTVGVLFTLSVPALAFAFGAVAAGAGAVVLLTPAGNAPVSRADHP